MRVRAALERCCIRELLHRSWTRSCAPRRPPAPLRGAPRAPTRRTPLPSFSPTRSCTLDRWRARYSGVILTVYVDHELARVGFCLSLRLGLAARCGPGRCVACALRPHLPVQHLGGPGPCCPCCWAARQRAQVGGLLHQPRSCHQRGPARTPEVVDQPPAVRPPPLALLGFRAVRALRGT